VTIVQRPARVAALVSAVQSALRARARQYQIREHLAERARTEEELRQNDRRKDEFLAILAHELRNPLAPISNGLQILRLAGSDDPQTAAIGRMMERQVGNLKRLVSELLDVSRVTRGDIDLKLERVELAGVARAAAETSLPLIEVSQHRLVSDFPDAPIYLEADPVRLGQVIANLLNNASKYTPPGGHIVLRLAREGTDAVVSVTDNGVGIPADALSSIFDLFMQVPQNRNRAQGGLGIGLTLARRLVELHGGSIEAWSEGPGKGSRFTIRLPVLDHLPQGTPEPVECGLEDLSGLRVVIADDNRDAADSLGLLLQQMGASICVTYGGAAAVEKLLSGGFDAGVIDLGMLDLNGLDVARRIRAQPRLRGTRLVALTGWGQARDLSATREAGFDGHLTKPVNLSQLVAHLRAAHR
jgi:signal transduction histidine kinase